MYPANSGQIQFFPNEKALHILSGLYQTAFKGRGIEFEDLREYISGDDPKIISWTKFAQTGQLYSKRYRQERDLQVYIIVDPSPSMKWARPIKWNLVMQAVSLISFSVVIGSDKLGAVIPTNQGVYCLRATKAKGVKHAADIIEKIRNRAMCYEENNVLLASQPTLTQCLYTLLSVLKQSGALVFVISDFLFTHQHDYVLLQALQKKADVVAIRVNDLWDMKPFFLGELAVIDSTVSQLCVYGGLNALVSALDIYTLHNVLYQERLRAEALLKRDTIDIINIVESDTESICVYSILQSFFQKRERNRIQKKGGQ